MMDFSHPALRLLAGLAVLSPFWLVTVAALSGAGETALAFASLLLPVYSALIAGVAFGFVIEAARKRGAPARPLAVRMIAGLVLTVSVIGGLVALTVGAFFAAGPKAFG